MGELKQEKKTRAIPEMSDKEIQDLLDTLATVESNEVGGLTIQLRDEQEKRKAKKAEAEKKAAAEREKKEQERNQQGYEMLKNIGKYFVWKGQPIHVKGVRLDFMGTCYVYECERAMHANAYVFNVYYGTTLCLTRDELSKCKETTKEAYDRQGEDNLRDMYRPFRGLICTDNFPMSLRPFFT